MICRVACKFFFNFETGIINFFEKFEIKVILLKNEQRYPIYIGN